jgi:hypothetical protein
MDFQLSELTIFCFILQERRLIIFLAREGFVSWKNGNNKMDYDEDEDEDSLFNDLKKIIKIFHPFSIYSLKQTKFSREMKIY